MTRAGADNARQGAPEIERRDRMALESLLEFALERETAAVASLAVVLPAIARAVSAVTSRPLLILTGIGKSGHVACRAASTFTSSGTPAVFVHATEALHGDAGLIGAGCAVVAVSKSGTTAEVVKVAQLASSRGCLVVAITTCSASDLARAADHVVVVPTVDEADPDGVLPTSSCLAAAACLDALAVGAAAARGRTRATLEANHPAGDIGRQAGDMAGPSSPSAAARTRSIHPDSGRRSARISRA